MAKFLGLWNVNPMAPMPTEPAEQLNFTEMLRSAMDYLLQTGEVEEFGFFLDGTSGYAIGAGESKDEFSRSFSFYRFIESEVRELAPYKTGKEVATGVLKSKAEVMMR
jgi:hypothetical protein